MTEHIDCNWVDERLEAFQDGALPSPEATALEVHLQACTQCRRALAQAERIRAGLRAWPQPECPDSVVHAVSRRAGTRPHRWPALAAAAAIGALGLGLSFTLNQHDPQPSLQAMQAARTDLHLALGYIAKAGHLAGHDVGQVLTGNAMRPIRQGLDLELHYPLPQLMQPSETET